MQTPETDAKAEAVRHFLVGKNVVVPEHHYMDRSLTPDDSRDHVSSSRGSGTTAICSRINPARPKYA